jgi:hypothetical protein
MFQRSASCPNSQHVARPHGTGLILTRLWLATRCGLGTIRAPGRRSAAAPLLLGEGVQTSGLRTTSSCTFEFMTDALFLTWQPFPGKPDGLKIEMQKSIQG